MGKLFGRNPSEYFEIVDNQSLNVAIDLACACAHWEDENYHYKKSQETAQDEAVAVNQVIEEQRRLANERG